MRRRRMSRGGSGIFASTFRDRAGCSATSSPDNVRIESAEWLAREMAGEDQDSSFKLREGVMRSNSTVSPPFLRLSGRPGGGSFSGPLKTKLKGKEKAISMGFGLHVGWAVEGAIGSKHKIDASYLSPHVNIAARLQAATKQFGVSMLLSGEFVDGLSSQLKRLCRPLDRVALKGSKEPMMLFSFEPRMDERKRYFDRFELGVEAYLNGEWEQARALLEGCVNSDPGDRPPAVLLEYMEERDFVAPPTWSGHRELTSK